MGTGHGNEADHPMPTHFLRLASLSGDGSTRPLRTPIWDHAYFLHTRYLQAKNGLDF